jgi:glycosyltransferase involved in cell wall biosynthesis
VDELIPWMQSDEFSHAELERHARRAHERQLRRAADRALAAGPDEVAAAAIGLFEACTPVIPYAPAAAFLAREKAKLVTRDGEPVRVALVADGVGGMHGVTHTLDEIRRRTVPGFEVEVIGTDPNVDRRLPSVADVEIPYYRGLEIGVPSLPSVVDALAEGRYGVVHLCSPGPAGVAAALVARVMGLPTVGSYHTELEAYARLRSEDERVGRAMRGGLSLFYGSCDAVLSPSEAADQSLAELGVPFERIGRWDRGVDTARFNPERRRPSMLGDGVNVLYAGRLTKEKGADLLADAFTRARERDARLQLVLAGGGPEEDRLRERLGHAATFLGWLEGDELAAAYASADLFLFASRTDTFGQVILEAQASGLPVVAVNEGGPTSLIEDGVSGRLCPPDADALARALLELVASPEQRRRMALVALASVRARTWERSMNQLAEGYARALGPRVAVGERDAA